MGVNVVYTVTGTLSADVRANSVFRLCRYARELASLASRQVQRNSTAKKGITLFVLLLSRRRNYDFVGTHRSTTASVPSTALSRVDFKPQHIGTALVDAPAREPTPSVHPACIHSVCISSDVDLVRTPDCGRRRMNSIAMPCAEN